MSQLFVNRISPVAPTLGTTIDVLLSPGARFNGGPWFDATHPNFGAKGDGVTNDGPAIQAAINAAAAVATFSTAFNENLAVGACVYLPPGIYATNQQIVNKNFVRVIGAGRSATVILAGSSFPINTPVFRLGDGTGVPGVFGCRAENLAIYCNNIAGSTGIYSDELNEQSGVRNCLINQYLLYGINVEDSGSQQPDNWLIEDCEMGCASSAGALATSGIRYSGLKQGGVIRRVTVNNNGAAGGNQKAGIWVVGTGGAGCRVAIEHVNAEQVADAILFDTNAGGDAKHITLATSGVNVVHIVSSQPVSLEDLYYASGTNTVQNDVLGNAITSPRLMRYEVSHSGTEGYQVATSVGQSSTHGQVTSNALPRFTVKCTDAARDGNSLSTYSLRDGNNDGWDIQFAPNLGSSVAGIQFHPVTASAQGGSVLQLNKSGNLVVPTTNGPAGTITLGAAATTVVSNSMIAASSLIFLFPTNAAAATLMNGTKSLYISAKSGGSSFTVATADGTNAAGTETFNYFVLN